jgi:hypothetical protein
MAHVSGYTLRIATTHDSHFLAAVRAMVRYRPHLNSCLGGESYRRKKLDGERPIQYAEIVGFLDAARRDGARRGQGAEAVAVLVNEILRDTLPEGAPLDVVARPVEGDPVPAQPRHEAQRRFAVSASSLVVTTEIVTADGHLDYLEARQLETTANEVSRNARLLITAAHAEGRR